MSASVAAHEVYSSNIANASTPGFTAQKPDFEIKLDQAKRMAQQQADSIIGGASIMGSKDTNTSAWEIQSKVSKSQDPANSRGNNVRLDNELASMSENNILYLSALRILSKEIALTKYAITTGGR
jgi:flagellar basal-body rod protein FlgB